MKTRVSRNAELYNKLSSDTESSVETTGLSHFANRLNAIDDQFGKMDISKEERNPHRARGIEDTLDNKPQSSFLDREFDTFESAYLKDFLDEVKDYNVKKGYRDEENTSTNIIRDLNLDIDSNKSRIISDFSDDANDDATPYVPKNLDSLLSDIDPLLSPNLEGEAVDDVSVSESDELDETRYFEAVDHLQRFDHSAESAMEETISMAVQRLADEEGFAVESDESVEVIEENLDLEPALEEVVSSSPQTSSHEVEEALHNALHNAQVRSVDVLESPNRSVLLEETQSHDTSNKLTQELFEQTQTLQYKIIDQEKNIEEINETMVRTNRLLNVVLSLLMLAIFVVLMLIVSSMWR